MSQKDSKTTTLDGIVYEVSMLPPRQALKLLTRITKIIGESGNKSIKELIQATDKMDETTANGVFFMGMACAIMSSLDDALVDYVVDTLASVTMADNAPLDKIYQSHFMGAVGRSIKWLAFALRSQFSDFGDVRVFASDLAQMWMEA